MQRKLIKRKFKFNVKNKMGIFISNTSTQMNFYAQMYNESDNLLFIFLIECLYDNEHGQYENAKGKILGAVKDPESIEEERFLLETLMDIEMLNEKYETALYYCKKLLELSPNNLDFIYTCSTLYYFNLLITESSELLNRLSKLDTIGLYEKDIEILYNKILEEVS